MYQTESEDVIISIEDKLGDEVSSTSKSTQSSSKPDAPKKRDVVWQAILDEIDNDLENQFKPSDVFNRVLAKEPDFSKATFNRLINRFHQAKEIVEKTLQERSEDFDINNLEITEEIVEIALLDYSESNGNDIRDMIDIFRKTKFDGLPVNQSDSETDKSN